MTARGVNLDPLFAPDGESLVFQRTDVENSLDLYVAPVRAAATPVRLSDSMPAGLNRADLGRADAGVVSRAGSIRRRCRRR